MSEWVKDVLYIKKIEREVGRELDDLDLEAINFGKPIFLQMKNTAWASYVVPVYLLPGDLFSQYIDPRAVGYQWDNVDFFSYRDESDT